MSPSLSPAHAGARPLAPLQVVGVLSALIFALNFSLEMLVLNGVGRNHQLLLVGLLLTLAGWCMFEVALLRKRWPKLQLGPLQALLGGQLLVECTRILLVFVAPLPSVDLSQGSALTESGKAIALLPIYVVIFLAVARALLACHTAELDAAYAALTAVAVEHSKSEERERLLQDMHDGFGSQLESARLMAEQDQLSTTDLRVILNECMTDLYLVADTLSHGDNTLADALADLRFRSDRRIRDQGVALHWDVALEAMPALPQRTQLQILRIVQEGLNNAVKHAHARNVGIRAHYQDQTLRVAVEDDGVGLPAAVPVGRGLRNMQQRARVIGATLGLQPKTPGTRLELVLQLPQPRS